MSNLLYIYETMMPTVSIMMDGAETLFSGKNINVRFQQIASIHPTDLDWADVVSLIRPNNILSYRLAKKAKKLGCFTIVFSDDDLLHMPSSLCSVPWRTKALRKSLRICDAVTSSSPYIAEMYAELSESRRGVCSDTVVSQMEYDMIPEKKAETVEITIVYAAGRDHSGMFSEYIQPIVPRLAEKYGDRISLAFVGVDVDTSSFDRMIHCEHYNGMPLHQYREFMRKKHFDIGIAPLHINNFNKCKYFNKFLEYAMVGTVGVYTRCEPYTYVVKDNVNGFLADNTPDSWYEALDKAIANKELRDRCMENSREQLRTQFCEEAVNERLLKELPELLQKKKHNRNCGMLYLIKFEYMLVRIGDLIYISLWNLRKGGFKQLVKKITGSIQDHKQK